MSAMLLIARRELGGYFRSMTGYVIAGLVLLIDGLLFNAFVLSAGEMYSADVLANFFYISFGTTVIASVFISMRLVAEERQTGTLVLMTSSPVHDWQIILGKYLSALAFLTIVTVGLWGIVWIIVALTGGERRMQIAIDEYGNVVLTDVAS